MIEEDFWSAPDTWSIKKFEHISKTVSGKAFDSGQFSDENKDGYTPVVRIRDIHNTDTESYTDEDFGFKYEVESGDLLVGMDGKFEASFWKGGNAALNQRVLKIESVENIKIEWIKFWLDIVLPYIHRQVPKATVKHLSVQKHLNPSVLPVPPLDEQERIVEAVSSRLERVERLKKGVENISRLTDEYQDSFSSYTLIENKNESGQQGLLSEDSIPDNWDMREMSEVSDIVSGYTFSSDNFQDSGVPLLKIGNVSNDYFEFDDFLPEDIFENTKDKYKLSDSEILLALSGATTGTTTKYRPDEMALLNQRVASIKPNENILNKNYLYKLLNSPVFEEKVETWKRGGGQANIRLSDIRGFQIPVPPMEEQSEIVETLSRINYSNLRRSVEILEPLFEEYRNSVLANAFTGRYTNQPVSDCGKGSSDYD